MTRYSELMIVPDNDFRPLSYYHNFTDEIHGECNGQGVHAVNRRTQVQS
jgi:hypothetical protein